MTKEEQSAYNKRYYLENKEKSKQKQFDYRAEHKEYQKQYSKKWFTKHKEYHKTYAADHKDHIAVTNAEWVKSNYDRYLLSCKRNSTKDRINLNESYLRRMIVGSSNLPYSAIDENIIMLKKVEISCKRFIENGSTKIPLKRHV